MLSDAAVGMAHECGDEIECTLRPLYLDRQAITRALGYRNMLAPVTGARQEGREGWGAVEQIYGDEREITFAPQSKASRNVPEAMTFQSE